MAVDDVTPAGTCEILSLQRQLLADQKVLDKHVQTRAVQATIHVDRMKVQMDRIAISQESNKAVRSWSEDHLYL